MLGTFSNTNEYVDNFSDTYSQFYVHLILDFTPNVTKNINIYREEKSTIKVTQIECLVRCVFLKFLKKVHTQPTTTTTTEKVNKQWKNNNIEDESLDGDTLGKCLSKVI